MDNKQVTTDIIKVMQAYIDGADIQFYNEHIYAWVDCPAPIWAWDDNEYRIKEPANWEIVKHFEEGGRVDVYQHNVFTHRKENNYFWDFSLNDFRIVNERRESNND